MNDIIKRQEFLPADFGDSLMKGIEDTRSTIVAAGGKPFFRLSRKGKFVFGQTDDEMQEGSRWAVNLASLERGWVCWGDGELLGQMMVSVQQPRPVKPAPIEGVPFDEQYALEMVCTDGDDAGTEVSYKGNSLGFKKAFDGLLADVRKRYLADQVAYWPIIELTTSSYDHKKYGEIFEPIFTVVAWTDADGNLAAAGPAPKVTAAPAKPAKAPLRAVETPPQAAAKPAERAEPVSTQQAHAGQRRRPAAR